MIRALCEMSTAGNDVATLTLFALSVAVFFLALNFFAGVATIFTWLAAKKMKKGRRRPAPCGDTANQRRSQK